MEHLHAQWPVETDDGSAAILDALEAALGRSDLDSALGLVQILRRRVTPQLSMLPSSEGFTERELATLALLPDGSLSQKDMAKALGVSHNTLKTHLRSLYLKLGAHSRAEAIERAELLASTTVTRVQRHLNAVH